MVLLGLVGVTSSGTVSEGVWSNTSLITSLSLAGVVVGVV